MYYGKSYPGVANPLWGQLNLVGISQLGTFPNQSMNPMIPTQYPPQTQYMGGPLGDRNVKYSTWRHHQANHNTWGYPQVSHNT